MTTQQKSAWFALFVLVRHQSDELLRSSDRGRAGRADHETSSSLSDTEFGFITTLFTLMYAVVGLPLGRLTDSWFALASLRSA